MAHDGHPGSGSDIVVAALYRFVALPDYRAMRAPLLAICMEAGVRGTLLLAGEGINGTLAGSRAGIDAVVDHLRSDPRLADLEPRESVAPAIPFKRLRVRAKKELISIGVSGVDPTRPGVYVEPAEWNALIADPDVRVIDTRNVYEVEIGTFRGAEDPGTESFSDFPAYVSARLDPARDRKLALFCTGGIRCEKATAYLVEQGFSEVYHLQGGILHYLETVAPEHSLWEGECFVFDERVSVRHGLTPGAYDACKGCGRPLAEADRVSELFEEGVSCPRCAPLLTDAQRRAFRDRQRQYERRR
ncbi:MAG: rhodanese-related sulfurtransferase [Rhodothermales bacterium]|nr:rhodanese-related sulfurtransferase [Rhodothermales bacterium]